MEKDDRRVRLDGSEVPTTGDDDADIMKRCREDRASLTPHETADCAGASYEERYENEEPGGA